MSFNLCLTLNWSCDATLVLGYTDHGDAQSLEFLAIGRKVQRFFGATGSIVLGIKIEDERRAFETG